MSIIRFLTGWAMEEELFLVGVVWTLITQKALGGLAAGIAYKHSLLQRAR